MHLLQKFDVLEFFTIMFGISTFELLRKTGIQLMGKINYFFVAVLSTFYDSTILPSQSNYNTPPHILATNFLNFYSSR